jgi:hypothetical protein
VKDSLIENSVGSPYPEGIDASRDNLGSATDLTAEGVAILNIDGVGFWTYTARASVSRTLVAHGKPTTTNPNGSFGFAVTSGGVLSVQDSAVVDIQGTGIAMKDDGSKLTASGVLLQQTTEYPPNVAGDGLGEAAAMNDGTTTTFTRVAMVANTQDALLVANGISANAPTVTLTECLISDTKPSPSKNDGGAGVFANRVTLTVENSRIERSTSAGIALLGTVGQLSGNVIDGVESGAFALRGYPTPAVPGVGDGILVARAYSHATNPNATNISGCWVSGAARAGILYSSSPGAVTGSTTSKSQYGLVIQGNPAPTIGSDNQFSGTAQATNGMLPSP